MLSGEVTLNDPPNRATFNESFRTNARGMQDRGKNSFMHRAPDKRLHCTFDRSCTPTLGNFSRNSPYYIVRFYAALLNCHRDRIPTDQADRELCR